MIKGYKAFNNDMTNRYGIPFESGKSYEVTGEIKFGNEGNGFHLCSSIADVFRYIDADDVNNYSIAQVYGFGDYKSFDDEYEGYYDMYSVRKIYIGKVLNRDEIFDRIKNLSEWQVLKVIKTSRLLPHEIKYLCTKYKNNITLICALLYYQLDQKDVYEKYYRSSMNIFEDDPQIKKVLKIWTKL